MVNPEDRLIARLDKIKDQLRSLSNIRGELDVGFLRRCSTVLLDEVEDVFGLLIRRQQTFEGLLDDRVKEEASIEETQEAYRARRPSTVTFSADEDSENDDPSSVY